MSEQGLSKLRWRSRRGMKELDVALTRYLDRHYQNASPDELQAFTELLALEDPPLFRLISGQELAEEPVRAALIAKIRGQ